MLRQAIITSRTANVIAVANAALIVVNERTYITPYPNARNTIYPWTEEAPAMTGRGKLAERVNRRYSALPLCAAGRVERPLVAPPRSGDLFICAKYLFVEARLTGASPGPNVKVYLR